MAAFSGYYDTGGAQHQGRVVVTAGVVATVDEWNEFDSRWLDVLRKYEIASFHMAEIAQWNDDNDISKWPLVDGKRDEQRRREFLTELALVGSGAVRQAFVRAVVLDDYRVIDARFPLTEKIGGPYSLAQAACLIQSQEWFQERSQPADKHQWRAMVEKGDAGQTEFRKFCEEYLVYMPQFEPKKNIAGEDITPLGLADLIAYEHSHLYTRIIKTGAQIPEDKWRGILRLLRERIPTDARVVEINFLNRMCAKLNLPVRSGAQ